jgi:hypothetical protein
LVCHIRERVYIEWGVFENRVLRAIFGSAGDDVTGEWRKFQNGELHTSTSSPDIIRQNKSRRMRWAGHVARMGEGRSVQCCGGKVQEEEVIRMSEAQMGGWDENGSYGNWLEWVWSGFSWLRMETGGKLL